MLVYWVEHASQMCNFRLLLFVYGGLEFSTSPDVIFYVSVVQLFNAVNKHQKSVKEKVTKAGRLESKRFKGICLHLCSMWNLMKTQHHIYTCTVNIAA